MGKYFVFGSGVGRHHIPYEELKKIAPDEPVEKNPELKPIPGFKLSGRQKDKLHQERLSLEEAMRPGIMSVDQMQAGESKHLSEDEQTRKYGQWRAENKRRMQRWHEINRTFKKAGEEGHLHTIDDIRNRQHKRQKVKYC